MENDIELVTSELTPEPVVIVQNAYKSYGTKKNLVCVLRNLSMTVPKGVIYGLLGSSGCGKTTLLNCVLGQRELDDGNVWILGGPPNSKTSKVPGFNVGYMPQSVGVQPEFTTRETMQYFGEITGMSKKQIKERTEFLKNLLMLPNLDLLIGNLSGGEKRRVSFAIALIHEPELLILDEPTVGLDPLLRESIWNYLYEITSKQQATVILTTHYIDEARNAHMVCNLLRGGVLLAEESPNSLLLRLEVPTLEDAFLMLSSKQSDDNEENQCVKNHYQITCSKDIEDPVRRNQINYLKPLIHKNYKWLIKNPMLVMFAIIIPALQILVFYIAIGHDPVNLSLAIVNQETTTKNCSPITCSSLELSCNFLTYLEKSKFNLVYYDDEDNAIKSVQHGKSYASIVIRFNYSLALKERLDINMFQNWDLVYSNIDVFRDTSEYNVALYLKAKILENFDLFVHDYLKSCGSNQRISLPVKFKEPIFGKKLPDFTEFAMPALILSSIAFFSAWSTASAMLTEFSNGVTERTLVLGVNPLLLLIAHAISEFLILAFHIIVMLICVFLILKFPLEGSLLIFALIVALEGICGMCFGFALSSVCTSDSVATYVILGSFFPAGLLSGIVWPLEGMPKVIRYVGYALPFSEAADGLRSIMQRGWGFAYSPIYSSIATILVWMFLLILRVITQTFLLQIMETRNDLTIPSNMVYVVSVRNAWKSYGSKKNCVTVLENANMSVFKGEIYGLLGPSGCGKTTLLNCILGQKQLNKGSIWILGGTPYSKASKVPGPHVGFMPQAHGIQDEYTTKETMHYFGGLAGMSPTEIQERMLFLQNLLMLPDLNVNIKNISGGEKRRVSFAVALLYNPELLILDEPTVGLDALLREKIWNYLHEITTKHQTTVILTTHYIEETRGANRIGLLRKGRILAEESPNNLLLNFGASTLEEVFFKLITDQQNMQINTETPNDSSLSVINCSNGRQAKPPNYLKPLVVKNIQWLIKNPILVIAAFFIPIMIILMFTIAIGGEPVNLNLAIVNDETSKKNCSMLLCNSDHLSCNFLNYLKSKFVLNYYNNEEEAIGSVMHGATYASLYFRHNYSSAFRKRINVKAKEDYDLTYSNIDVYRDLSQYSLAVFLKIELLRSFKNFGSDYIESCGISNDKVLSLPFKWQEPIHGKSQPNFSQFVIPALVVSSLTFIAAWSTASSLITELNIGITERSLVMGVNRLHLLFGHAVSEFLVVSIQLISITVCTYIVTDVPFHLSMYLILVFYALMGFLGMCYGTYASNATEGG
ncbi:hypothetical protein FQR65_LT08846 [Abscondita terminalis]|nr:hypothetical protein FQR65_LT08846 [Abscondita terminalis]